MAFNFAAMARVFEKESKEKILKKLDVTLSLLEKSKDEAEFTKTHNNFCSWFKNNIKRSKSGAVTSYGHGAKILDVVTKVYFYYCKLPESKVSKNILMFLRVAIDGPVLKYVKSSGYKEIKASSIAEIDFRLYKKLQLMLTELREKESSSLLPVEYEDLLRCRLTTKK